MRTIMIETTIGSYPVILGEGAIGQLPSFIKDQPLLLITDETVANHHLKSLLDILDGHNIFTYTLSNMPEQDKHLGRYHELVSYALSVGFPRSGCVIAFGGGAVGDFAGYFAATYMRGVDYIQVPTTILAHDSSVGGKVAVNHDGVKNIIGCFYAPKAIVYDFTFLKTLPIEEVYSGFGELIKHSLLTDGRLIDRLKDERDILDIDFNELEAVIEQAIMTKYRFIENDVYDRTGTRKSLNLGHTLGHGIETTYKIPHGIAILFGICYSTFLVNEELGLSLYRRFARLGFFRSIPTLDSNQLLKTLIHDKKNRHVEELHFIGLERIGKPVSVYLTPMEFRTTIQQFLARTECYNAIKR